MIAYPEELPTAMLAHSLHVTCKSKQTNVARTAEQCPKNSLVKR